MSAVCFVSRYTEPTPNNAKHLYNTVLNKPHYSNLGYTLLHYATLLQYSTFPYTTPHSPTLCHTLLAYATLSYTMPHSPTTYTTPYSPRAILWQVA